ncbi:hypothetical protein JL722_2139 [Aureococcus anophagefferens]|nr:hypothetical protein JL722_2139 [Aureococcus anophagefferens]
MADRLLVSERQRGNPLLKHLRNVAWRFEKKLVPDYVVGEKHCAVFISIRYHLLKPSYLSRRLAELKAETWRLRVLLCHVDLDDAAKALHELNVLAVKAECTLILGHSDRECAYECFKAYERNSAACIKDKVDGTHHAQLADARRSGRRAAPSGQQRRRQAGEAPTPADAAEQRPRADGDVSGR